MTGQNGYIALMNTMCDMTKFVVVVPVPDETSATLASHFMQHVLLKFGMCHLVVIDYGSPFKGSYVAMCQALNLNYDVLAKRNHKELSVEHFHRFLNKSVTIAAKERGTNDIFVLASIAAVYAWNSVPIDGTDIIRSVPAISRSLNLPLDINLNTVPKLIQNNAQAHWTTLILLTLVVILLPLSLRFLSRIVEPLMLSVSITQKTLLF